MECGTKRHTIHKSAMHQIVHYDPEEQLSGCLMWVRAKHMKINANEIGWQE